MLSRERTARLQDLGREENATPFMVLLSAFQLLLHRYCGLVGQYVDQFLILRSEAAVDARQIGIDPAHDLVLGYKGLA